MKNIKIINARVNNLKNVSLEIPKNKLTVITGLSGSGKSSLAFDTIYAEGQRRYAESLNAYARQFMDLQDKPDVDDIQGLSPTIAIDQKTISQNPRSTVGTTTEIYDYLRLLFARIGKQFCPDCNSKIIQSTTGEIIEKIRNIARTSKSIAILTPIIKQQPIKIKQILTRLEQTGLNRIRLNNIEQNLADLNKIKINKDRLYDIDIIVGKITDLKKQNTKLLADKALELGNGSITVLDENTGEEHDYSLTPYCRQCHRMFVPIESRTFSFNSPYGACQRCSGLGKTLEVDPELIIPNTRLTLAEGAIQPWTRIVGNQNMYQTILEAVAVAHNFSTHIPVKELSKDVIDILYYGTDGKKYIIGGKMTQFEGIIPNLITRHAETNSDYVRKEIEGYMREHICSVCKGKRLKPESLSIKILDYDIADLVEMNVEEACNVFIKLAKDAQEKKETDKKTIGLSVQEKTIATPIVKELKNRLENLMQVGLYYISLDRPVNTLSGGEAQRVRLSTQLSTGLTGVIYILDEPSIGLHPKDNDKLIKTLKQLRDLGNTVIVVEHDEQMMNEADHIVDIGPGAGIYGGEVVASGTAAKIKKNKNSQTGLFLSGKEKINPPKKTRKGDKKTIDIIGAKAFNLKNIDVSIPLATLTCVTGVSGSGKSTLIIDILSKALHKKFYRAKAQPGLHKKINGVNNINKIISIDQAPIGRTPRSNPATYTGLFTAVRDIFTDVPEAKMRGMDAGKFSFNVKGGGRCEACAGQGYICIPMQFLSDVFVECNECQSKRYNQETLDIHYRGKTIADVLDMTVEEAYSFFAHLPAIADKLRIIRDVGLGYVHLGQSATTLSGGEAQRIKLATELSRRSTGSTLYILDEPTTGLHFADIQRLLDILNKLVDRGNTVLIIEHNLDVIKSADWIIDLGPGGGEKGGELVIAGPPKEVIKNKTSWTAKYLKDVM
ncbi:MAG: excinuclease ABC subunit UvrA [Candidatus Magasanikbacteria bacterium CG_4_10_14_0_2_um_filter_37_12]|uniref:UvrABC system protein A n=1 Tax=Candidatus Magasanikbacteria bacterium CG_4_10_14_0_2_um_filter_37_12 TaxID=1974637 RepID=A0A2M7V9K3_9BACT|nr:MAG: excinuclease ABC subunit UvrA [Candidatus Magasanikbacteria bacterium CG_4_10_14_0_2_um_filter_37_12]